MTSAVQGRKVRRNAFRRTVSRRESAKVDVRRHALRLWFLLKFFAGWVLGLAFVLAVSMLLLFSYHWVTTLEFFNLVNLQIQGQQRFSAEEIAELGGIARGENVLSINIANVQRRIASSEWVENVSVTRVLPNGLNIDVKEYEPAFLVRRENRLFYADKDGQPFASVNANKFVSLPVLEKEGDIPLSAAIHRLLEKISHNALPFGMRQLAWIRQDSAEQFSLFLTEPPLLVQLDGVDVKEAVESLNLVWRDLGKRGELEKMASLFVMPGRAWVRPATTGENGEN